jgi:hypothetical protein
MDKYAVALHFQTQLSLIQSVTLKPKWTSITVYPRTPEVDGGVSQFDVGVP